MKQLLFTGATGFVGSHIKPILDNHYRITTIGIDSKDNVQVDLSESVPELSHSYDIVLHVAGKAHAVPRNPEEEQSFYNINYQGTVNLCRSLEVAGIPRSLIFISTVAVYGVDTGNVITEDHPLNGSTPYVKSKIMAEQFLQSWCADHNVALSIIRPSLVAGPNPPGNLGAMIHGIKTGCYLSIAKGKARKSVLMVEDIARLIPLLDGRNGIYNICDDNHPSFGELEQLISSQLHKSTPISVPYWIAKLLALCGNLLGAKAPINTNSLDKITGSLTFSNAKAKKELDWIPLSVLDNFIIE